jgi:hypothetical protein
MCWFKRTAYLSAFFLLACGGQQEASAPRPGKYFDLAGYFKAQGEAFTKRNVTVAKTIVKNGRSEGRTLNIADWGKELGLFAASDINKPAWASSYNTSQSGDTLIYRSLDPDMRTQLIEIVGSPDSVIMIYIRNQEENALYKSLEELRYYPDSLYRIEKKQDIRFIGINEYQIEGSFKEN